MGLIVEFLGSLAIKLLGPVVGGFIAKKLGVQPTPTDADATPVEMAQKLGADDQIIAQQDAANAVVTKDASASTDADARILRESAEPVPPGAPAGSTSGLDADPEGHWRND